MIILKLNCNKDLSITKNSNLYQGENNADIIRLFLCKEINSNDLQECSVLLNIGNPEGKNISVDVSSKLIIYNDDIYTCDILIENNLTYISGVLDIWLEIINGSSEMIAKTNSVCCTINPHMSVGDDIPEQEISLIESLLMRINNLSVELGKATQYIDKLQQGVVFLAKKEE